MQTIDPETIIASHIEPGESVQTAFTAYVNAGLRRRVIGATDRRLIVVRSGYFSLSDKGLSWADPLDQVALYGSYSVWLKSGLNTGNAYVRIRRANGSTVTFNPRNSFIGQTGSAEANIKKLFALIPGRV
ncbi:hypothetical protein AB0F17_37385 [Nonomuraea sp. NPDC026600]|uniref:hypothetical protein n=1 Tax=Nonomuraea sp. NPDC026600 TaxID=3155363 RepID=UPI0033D302C4